MRAFEARGLRTADVVFFRFLFRPALPRDLTGLFPDFSAIASPEAAISRVALAIVPAARPTPRARALSNGSVSLSLRPRVREAFFFSGPFFGFRDSLFRTGRFAFTSAPPQPISRQ
jgi:hypothetical protein